MIFGWGDEKKRKPFKLSTKKIEWMKAAGKNPDDPFVKTSKCRQCKDRLVWGKGGYEFDHRNNDSSDNSQKNCYLVCSNCHIKATKIDKRKIKEPFLGTTVGYKTFKRKIGYKKPKVKPKPIKKKRKAKSIFDLI